MICFWMMHTKCLVTLKTTSERLFRKRELMIMEYRKDFKVKRFQRRFRKFM